MMRQKAGGGTLAQVDALTWTAVLSTPEPDCVNDRIFGWSWAGESVPLLVGHDSARLPVGRVFPRVEGGRLVGKIVFAAAGTSTDADEARALVEAGAAGALSIGFNGRGRPNDLGGQDFDNVRVFEVSLVGVGCNLNAAITGKRACACAAPRIRVTVTATAPAERVYKRDEAAMAIGRYVRGLVHVAVCDLTGELPDPELTPKCCAGRFQIGEGDARAVVATVAKAALRAELARVKQRREERSRWPQDWR